MRLVRISLLALFVLALTQLHAQVDPLSDPAYALELQRAEAQAEAAKASAWALFSAQGYPTRGITAEGVVYELMAIEDGQPVYYATCNREAAISTAANLIRNVPPYNLSGTGFIIGLWDSGTVFVEHQEFGGRVVVRENTPNTQSHGTHIAGTLGAAGVVARAMGMAPAVSIDSYNWSSDTTQMRSRAAASAIAAGKIHASNHSYVTICGWNSGDYSGTQGPHWFGVWGEREDRNFGRYDSKARDWDQTCVTYPYYLPFKAAGNERTHGAPAAGTLFFYRPNGITWQGKTYDPETDPYHDYYKGGYDTINSYGVAKNIMTVGAANDAVSGGSRNLSVGTITSFSSWGPTDDGRIKPDIVANGASLYSTGINSVDHYTTSSGTSMASPNAAASAILVQELYARLYGAGAMRSSTLKGLLLHTADDMGNAGPDYSYGWGYLNVKRAADLVLEDHQLGAGMRIREGLLATWQPQETHFAYSTQGGPIKVTLCWTDPAATAVSGLNNSSPRLINDLDLRVRGPGDILFEPYVLDPANPQLAATRGDNTRDNIEQVHIPVAPLAGEYRIFVTHKGSLSGGSQRFSLIVSSNATPPPAPSETATPTPSFTATWTATLTPTWTTTLTPTSTPTLTASFTSTPTSTPTSTWTPTPTPTLSPARFDLNGDGWIDALDLEILYELMGGADMKADFNQDSRVDGLDLLLFSQHWKEQLEGP